MDQSKERLSANSWTKSSSSGNDILKNIFSGHPFLTNFNSQQLQQESDDLSIEDYNAGIEQPFQELMQHFEIQSSCPGNPNNQIKLPDQDDDHMIESSQTDKIQDWDPKAMLNNLSFLKQKIHQLQDLVNLIVGGEGQILEQPDELAAQQQQLITADLASILIQLISTAGSLLPSVSHSLGPALTRQLGGLFWPAMLGLSGGVQAQNDGGSKVSDQSNQIDLTGNGVNEQNYNIEENESKDDEDANGENLPPGSYEILQLEKEEILKPRTHFCLICMKGFKRDANLRMHMRGHGDVYKTAAALAKPNKESSSKSMLITRYSCPYPGCKRNKDHKKFQPLKTIQCVKNHYKRTHCAKSFICSRCNTKKFSVIADLRTHEKHCGKDKWRCSCGSTFSRKDKLLGHIAVFPVHSPAIPLDETKGPSGARDQGEGNEAMDKVRSINDGGRKVSDQSNQIDLTGNGANEQDYNIEENESKDDEDANEGENLSPGSYEILQLEKEEILKPRTHFCLICGKGFKRDANLRMHMRGHGDGCKTAAALAKPNKESSSRSMLITRYSCPYRGCKRNKDHKKFQPLKTIQCVKIHYKRTHCAKSLICSRCNTKKFSVIADLRTHEKHCGKDKWRCSCGTTFSSKDKLLGHITLFRGHTPAIPLDETKGPSGPLDQGEGIEAMTKVRSINFNFCSNSLSGSGVQNTADVKVSIEDPSNYFSPSLETCSFSGFHDFPQPPFEDSESSFSFFIPGSSSYSLPGPCNYTQEN